MGYKFVDFFEKKLGGSCLWAVASCRGVPREYVHFNNILSAVFGYTELALGCLDDGRKCGRYLEQVLNAAKRARDLVNQILAFSRKTEPGLKPVVLRHAVKETLKLLRASLPATIEMIENLTSSATVLADPAQVHQVIVNLCTNAGYAMKEEGGVLEVELEDITDTQDLSIQKAGLVPGRYVRLTVSDTGRGIPAAVVERIFDPFFTTKPPGEGTGLGLSVVHGIVKGLNGSISVSSKPGRGTRFTVYFPAIQDDIAVAGVEREQDLPRGSERVLLLDDEEAIVQSGTERLEGLGYRVKGFTLASSALEAFLNDPYGFDVVVSDYTMPRMTGYELALKIRQVRPDMPVILCSGYFAIEERVAGLEKVEFLQKPVATHALAEALRRALASKEPPSN